MALISLFDAARQAMSTVANGASKLAKGATKVAEAIGGAIANDEENDDEISEKKNDDPDLSDVAQAMNKAAEKIKQKNKPSEEVEGLEDVMGEMYGEDVEAIVLQGTKGDDEFNVSAGKNGKIIVEVNGKKHQYTAEEAKRLILDGSGGNDNIHIDEDVYQALFVTGGKGDDTITGGSGNDIISDNHGSNTIDGGQGDDLIVAMGKEDKDGNVGNNTVRGGQGNDTIVTGEGNDTVFGDDGDDNITTNGGDDTINAGSGNDVANAGAGNDTVYGGMGSDYIKAGSGEDYVYDMEGNNAVLGQEGNDTILMGKGNDYVNTGDGKDTLVDAGGAGATTASTKEDSISKGTMYSTNTADYVNSGVMNAIYAAAADAEAQSEDADLHGQLSHVVANVIYDQNVGNVGEVNRAAFADYAKAAAGNIVADAMRNGYVNPKYPGYEASTPSNTEVKEKEYEPKTILGKIVDKVADTVEDVVDHVKDQVEAMHKADLSPKELLELYINEKKTLNAQNQQK